MWQRSFLEPQSGVFFINLLTLRFMRPIKMQSGLTKATTNCQEKSQSFPFNCHSVTDIQLFLRRSSLCIAYKASARNGERRGESGAREARNALSPRSSSAFDFLLPIPFLALATYFARVDRSFLFLLPFILLSVSFGLGYHQLLQALLWVLLPTT